MINPTPKRFIAGAVCPRCAAMDKLRCWRDEVREYRECVDCGYDDSMRLDGAPDPVELPTRVNKPEQVAEAEPDTARAIQIIPIKTLKD